MTTDSMEASTKEQGEIKKLERLGEDLMENEETVTRVPREGKRSAYWNQL